jgi:hypothetical protein
MLLIIEWRAPALIGMASLSCPNLDGVPNEGSTPVAPAFGTTLCRLVLKELLCGLEVGQEVVVWLHGDDLPVLRPDLLEQREQELATLGGLGLQVPEAGELFEQRSGAVDGGFGGWALALEFFL